MKHRGSISHKYSYFATLILLAIFSFTQSVLTSVKKIKLRELIGEVEEEEPEGDAVVGPRGEATTHSSGSTPLFSKFCAEIYLRKFWFFFLQLILPILYSSPS